MTQLVQALSESHITPPSMLAFRNHDDYILALALIYIGMEQCLPTMPEEPDELWAWALS